MTGDFVMDISIKVLYNKDFKIYAVSFDLGVRFKHLGLLQMYDLKHVSMNTMKDLVYIHVTVEHAYIKNKFNTGVFQLFLLFCL